MAFFIIPRYGKSLQSIVRKQKESLNLSSVLNLGIHLLNILEAIHDSGLVYNDLKLDNILLDMCENLPKISKKSFENCFENLHLNLIDFGLVSHWQNPKTSEHYPEQMVNYFRGNIYFASCYKFEYLRASRRDDLHSLTYLLIYLLNDCQIPALDELKHLSLKNKGKKDC